MSDKTITDKDIELLSDVQDSVGDGAYLLGCTVYDRNGNYVATLSECSKCGNPIIVGEECSKCQMK
jgi:hypothetical protein